MTQEMEGRIKKAVEYFMEGYGCCQSVAAAFSDIYGMDKELALKTGLGFGAGVGKLRMMCGAVSGLVILSGLKSGTLKGDDHNGKAACYKEVQELVERFRQENGSIICAELLGLKSPSPKGDFVPAQRNAEYYKTRPCASKVESAARIFAELLDKEREISE